MDILHAVQELLYKKQSEMLAFEEVTQNMLTCTREKLIESMQEREEIIKRVDQIDAEIKKYCEQSTDKEHLEKIVNNSADQAALSEEEKNLYRAAQQVQAVFSRLEESDLQAAMRLRLEQELILEQIKSTNQGNSAKASRFFSNGATPSTGTTLLRNV